MYRFRSFGRNIFVCVTLIGVKSKYGSGWGTSPGLMNINDTPKKKSLCKEHKLLSIYMVQIHKHLCKQHKLLVIYMVQIHKQAHSNFILLSTPQKGTDLQVCTLEGDHPPPPPPPSLGGGERIVVVLVLNASGDGLQLIFYLFLLKSAANISKTNKIFRLCQP